MSTDDIVAFRAAARAYTTLTCRRCGRSFLSDVWGVCPTSANGEHDVCCDLDGGECVAWCRHLLGLPLHEDPT